MPICERASPFNLFDLRARGGESGLLMAAKFGWPVWASETSENAPIFDGRPDSLSRKK